MSQVLFNISRRHAYWDERYDFQDTQNAGNVISNVVRNLKEKTGHNLCVHGRFAYERINFHFSFFTFNHASRA